MTANGETTVIRVVFEANGETPLGVVGRTLDDLNALCELVVSLSSERYAQPAIGAKDWRVRRWSRLHRDDQLAVQSLRLSSPLVMDILVPLGIAATSGWALVQALEKVANWRSEGRLRRLHGQREAVGLERDQIARDRERLALARETEDLEALVRAARAEKAFDQATGRLAEGLPIAAVVASPPGGEAHGGPVPS